MIFRSDMESLETLEREASAIQEFLETPYCDDPHSMSGRLTELNIYMARSGAMLAEAVRLQDEATGRVYAEYRAQIGKMPATIATRFIQSQCVRENHLVKWLERINASCKHQSDNLRTQISFAKEQLNLTRTGY